MLTLILLFVVAVLVFSMVGKAIQGENKLVRNRAIVSGMLLLVTYFLEVHGFQTITTRFFVVVVLLVLGAAACIRALFGVIGSLIKKKSEARNRALILLAVGLVVTLGSWLYGSSIVEEEFEEIDAHQVVEVEKI